MRERAREKETPKRMIIKIINDKDLEVQTPSSLHIRRSAYIAGKEGGRSKLRMITF